MTASLKAGDRERVSALRLIVNELQKAAKEGNPDEIAVLQRERKRRLEAAEAYRDAERQDLAESEEREAAIIEGYMPEQISDEDLRAFYRDLLALRRELPREAEVSIDETARTLTVRRGAVELHADFANTTVELRR